MSKRSVQLNIRTEANVAQALREEAQQRGLPLSEVLKELLTRARASTGSGVWLALSPEVNAALRGVAAARALEPEQLLRQLVAGELRTRILEMAEELNGALGQPSTSSVVREDLAPPTGDEVAALGTPDENTEDRRNPAQGLPLLDDEDEPVGIFTVFE